MWGGSTNKGTIGEKEEDRYYKILGVPHGICSTILYDGLQSEISECSISRAPFDNENGLLARLGHASEKVARFGETGAPGIVSGQNADFGRRRLFWPN